jgi:cytidine deaminase
MPAKHASLPSVSYRDFKVGATVFAMRNSPATSQFITGANIKPDKDSSVNVHAEQSAMKRARQAGFTAISIVAVVGETQDDQQSGHQMCTLHPCGLCRETLGQSPLIDNNLTLIATAHPDLRTIELSTITKLGQYHEAQAFDDVTRIDVPELELLTPFVPLPNQRVIELNDTNANLEEDRTWHGLLDTHLLPLRMGTA